MLAGFGVQIETVGYLPVLQGSLFGMDCGVYSTHLIQFQRKICLHFFYNDNSLPFAPSLSVHAKLMLYLCIVSVFVCFARVFVCCVCVCGFNMKSFFAVIKSNMNGMNCMCACVIMHTRSGCDL